MQHKSNRYKKFCLSSKKSLILLTIYNAKIYAKTISEVHILQQVLKLSIIKQISLIKVK